MNTMKITAQCSTYQYNENNDKVSYWCETRNAWITIKEFREHHPFDTKQFSQPYFSEDAYDEFWDIGGESNDDEEVTCNMCGYIMDYNEDDGIYECTRCNDEEFNNDNEYLINGKSF